MAFLFILKLLVVAFFLLMFLRGSKVVWGIGLLSVSSAFLLDTILGTFGTEEIREKLGFFYFIIAGALFSGTGLWLWGLMRKQLDGGAIAGATSVAFTSTPDIDGENFSDTHHDRHMLYEEIHHRLSPEDIRDLIFDLELNENDVLAPHQEMTQTIKRIVIAAERERKLDALALAVERILTPVSPENLPRREKLSATSPPTVLRHFLLAHYTLDELPQMASALDVDWEQLGAGGKKEMVRNLLFYLDRRDRLDELILLIQEPAPAPK